MSPSAPSHKFRSMMQQLWLNKLKNSPQRRIQNAITWMMPHLHTTRQSNIPQNSDMEQQEHQQKQEKSLSWSNNKNNKYTTMKSYNSKEENKRNSNYAQYLNSVTHLSSLSQSESSFLHVRSSPSSLSSSESSSSPSPPLSSINLPSSWLPASLTSSANAWLATQRFRDKVQEALHTATCKVEEKLRTSHEIEANTNVADSNNTEKSIMENSAYSSNNNNSSQNNTSVNVKNATPESFYRRVQETLRDTREYYSSIPFDERWDDIQRSLAVLGRVSVGNTVIPYRDSGEAFAAMWHAVDNGQREVLWQTYICKDDYVGQVTVHKLVEAHRRGCITELLYDSGGNISGRAKLTQELRLCGARVIAYRPFFRSFVQYMFGGFDWRISPGLRNHRKILLVDNAIGFCGGLNIGNDYCGVVMGGTGTFRDTHCAVRGRAVGHLREVYYNTKQPQPWKFSWRRWRQIASTSMNRRYNVGKQVMESNLLKPIQAQTRNATRRGGIYFYKQLRKAEAHTERMIGKLRWERQRDRLLKWMRWFDEHISSSNTRKLFTEGNNNRSSKANEMYTIKNEENSEDDNMENFSITEENGKTNSGDDVEEQAKSKASTFTDIVTTTSTTNNNTLISNRVMKRKVSEARLRALSSATDMSHKRSYTRILLHTPITDDEPVPEAEMYSLHRQSSTQILSCNPREHEYSIQYALWQVTRKCHRRLWLTTPYYLPTRKLLKALQRAARRGVDVRILAGSRQTTDPWFMWHASSYITEYLLRAGVRIYEYKGTEIMHAKTIVVDSVWSSIGSYNWDLLSNKNLEVCLCHLDVSLAREMETHFLHDLRQSEEIALQHHTSRSWWLRFTSWLFYHGVYLVNRLTFFSYMNDDVEDSGYNFEHEHEQA